MRSMIRCPACGRRRKNGHEKRCGTDKAYVKGENGCKRYSKQPKA